MNDAQRTRLDELGLSLRHGPDGWTVTNAKGLSAALPPEYKDAEESFAAAWTILQAELTMERNAQ